MSTYSVSRVATISIDEFNRLSAESQKFRSEIRELEVSFSRINFRIQGSMQKENTQLERDVVDMIACCKEYRAALRTLQQVQDDVNHSNGVTEKMREVSEDAVSCRRNLQCTEPVCLFGKNGTRALVNKGVQVLEDVPQAHTGENRRLLDHLARMQKERAKILHTVHELTEEKKVMQTQLSQCTTLIVQQEGQIEHLEFLLSCEDALARKDIRLTSAQHAHSHGASVSATEGQVRYNREFVLENACRPPIKSTSW